MAEQQVLRMARPADWWARRAALHHRRGNRQQAEVLYRHAVALTPDNVSLKLAYARVLQEAHRYEASNRQAFAVLSLSPDCPGCVSLIGQNLMALGFLEEAADAFSHALRFDTEGLAEADADSLDRLDMLLYPGEEPGIRYRLFVRRAAEYVAQGAWDAAKEMLSQACAMPRRDEQCHMLMALYCRVTGDMEQAIAQTEAACRVSPRSPRAFCALAELFLKNGQRGEALRALLQAAARVFTAADEALLCQTAIHLGFPTAPLPTLARLGGRVHTLYNQGVLWLMAGQPEKALPVLNRCRALDPDDIPSRYLLRTAQALAKLPHELALQQAQALRLYPALSDADSEDCFRTFLQALEDGPEAFARRLQTDTALYRLLLYQAENPNVDISGTLEQGIAYLKENFTIKLLREILTLPMGGMAEKQLAMRLLLRGEGHSFVLWHDGRLSFVEPHANGETPEATRLKEQLLHCAAMTENPRLMTHALRLIRRMPPRMRLKIAAAQDSAFTAAVQLHYAQRNPAAAVPQTIHHQRHVRRISAMLSRIAPDAPQKPRLWLSKGRERRPHETD